MKAFKVTAAWAAISVAVLATPAHAGWRFTQWGMTAEQVIAASNGKVGPRDPAAIAKEDEVKAGMRARGVSLPQITCTLVLLEPLVIAGMTFDDVRLCFSTAGRLTMVETRTKSDARQVADALAQSLGRAVATRDPELPVWIFVDREHGNGLELKTGVMGGATLVYTEIATGF